MYSIKEISEITGLTYHTIRYYTDQNLIPDVIRDSNNNRLFGERSIKIFNCLRNLKNSGLTIKELKEFIDFGEQGDISIPERKEIMTRARKQMEEKMLEMQESLAYLKYKEDFYDKILRGEIPNRGIFKKE